MELSICKLVLNESPIPYMHVKVILDERNNPRNFIVLDVNTSFESLAGIDKSLVLNKEGFKVLPNVFENKSRWTSVFYTALKQVTIDKHESRVRINNRTLKINIIRVNEDELAVFFEDVELSQEHQQDLEKMIEYSQDFLLYSGVDIDYQKIVDDFMQICSGKFAVFNLFSIDGRNFKTKAISCESKLLTLGTKMLGFNIKDKNWPYDPIYFQKIEKSKITYFKNLNEIIGDALPKTMVSLIQRTFNIGEVVVIKIMLSERILGEFTVFMEKGKHFQRDYLAELYTNHVGLLLTRYESEVDLAKDKQFLETTLLSISDGVISVDLNGNILLINKVAQQLTGFNLEEAIGRKIEEIFFIRDERVENALDAIFKEVISTRIIVEKLANSSLISKDGTVRPIVVTASPILDQKQNFWGVVFVFSDFTEKKLQQDKIGWLSFHDQLTGLYNRRFYEEELLRIDQPRNLPISLIIGDVNGLKLINDSFGHQLGDELLVKIAEVIKHSSRADDIIARLGGDEFVLILPSTTSTEAEELILRINDNAKKEYIAGIPLSISFGSATKTEKNQNLSSVFKDAEDIMYTRKLHVGERFRSKTIDLMMTGLFERSPWELNHSKRVSELCKKIALKMGLDDDEVKQIEIAGLMHDIGKIGISEEILNKRDILNDEEWLKVKRHSEIGYRILSSINEFSVIADFILETHEKVDGSGYPRGLKGDEISVQGKIIGLADAFDSMTSMKPYGSVLTMDEAISEINRCSGKQFDEAISRIFIEQVLKKA